MKNTNIFNFLCTLIALGLLFLAFVKGHGRLVDPPARNVMWQYGYDNPINVDLNQLNCGGTSTQWSSTSSAVGQCGLCGDPYNGPRKHEAGYPGNEYANGVIGRVYKQEQTITVTVAITANHFGWFQFSICAANNNEKLTQSCFRNLTAPGDHTKTMFPVSEVLPSDYKGVVDITLQLPPSLLCSQCVIQWFWYAGNSVGKLPQETFINCADVTITRADGTLHGTGLVMPQNILPQAYRPTPKPYHSYGEGRPIGLSAGRWDCVASVLTPDPKKDVVRGWCLENCLFAQPGQRSCPVENCKCSKENGSEDSDRQELGVADPYPRLDASGNTVHARQGICEGEWQCWARLPHSNVTYQDWCMNNCVRALPSQIACSFEFCVCHLRGKSLTDDQIQQCLQPTQSETSHGNESGEETTSAPHQDSLKGQWDCDVVSPYDSKSARITADYKEWCLNSCTRQAKQIRLCVTTVCRCFRTDVILSERETRIQLGDSAYDILQGGGVENSPSQLNRIGSYYIRSEEFVKESKVLDWDCESLHQIPHSRGYALQYSINHRWCLTVCLRNMEIDECDELCDCKQAGNHPDSQNRELLDQTVDARQIIHPDPVQSYATRQPSQRV